VTFSPESPEFSNSRRSAPIDPGRVRSLFARPQRVAESAFLRREVATRMFERLELIRLDPQCLIDAGCGEGADLSLLQQRYPGARLLGIDGAAAMLACARDSQVAARSALRGLLAKLVARMSRAVDASDTNAQLICADYARMPLATGCADLIWSNLALHWHAQPDRVFAEWRRLLRVDGLLMFSCFGPDTFKEVRAVFAAIGENSSVLPFVDLHDLGDMLVAAGFADPVMDMEMITVTYASLPELWSDLRAWGGNPLSTRRRGLIGRSAWQRLQRELESLRRSDGQYSLTFEVLYGHAFRPEARKTEAGESIIRFEPTRKPR